MGRAELVRAGNAHPLTPGQLATAANVAPSSMTHRLDKMMQRGLIDRSGDPDHRSRVQVRLTDEGYALYARAIRDADLVESDLLAALDEAEVSTLAQLLEQVLAGLDGPTSG